MYFRNIVSALALSSTAFATYPLELVYQFENSFSGVGYVNIENVAVRQSNGQLLLNLATGAILAQLNPDSANPQPELLVNISNAYPGAPGSLTGIAQTGHDVYTVAAGNFVFGPQVPGGINTVPGSFSVWNVDLSGHEAVAKKVVDIPEAGGLNGMTRLPGKGNKDIVLIADSALGAIWKVNVKTGAYSQFVADPLLLPNQYFPFGVNGIHIGGPYLYFTNSAAGIFGAFRLSEDGAVASAAIPFVTFPNGTSPDDFALDAAGNAYVAGQPNSVVLLERENVNPIIIAGGGDDQTLLGPTSAVIRGPTELFVVTGGAGGPRPQSGQVFKITIPAGQKLAKRWSA